MIEYDVASCPKEITLKKVFDMRNKHDVLFYDSRYGNKPTLRDENEIVVIDASTVDDLNKKIEELESKLEENGTNKN